MKILIVGAMGETAGLIVPALHERGAVVRALVRKPEQIQRALDRGAAEVAMGDLENAGALLLQCGRAATDPAMSLGERLRRQATPITQESQT